MSNEVMKVNNEAQVMYEDNSFIRDLTAPASISYCSMVPLTDEEEKQLFNAMNNPAHRVAEMINKTISLKNVYVEVVTMVNQDTGEAQTAPRVVLMDDKNEGYACVSTGIFSALKKIFQIKGTPEQWEKPVKVEVKEIRKGGNGANRNILTLNMV